MTAPEHQKVKNRNHFCGEWKPTDIKPNKSVIFLLLSVQLFFQHLQLKTDIRAFAG